LLGALTALLATANLIFALRSLDVIARSRTSIDTKEPMATLPSLSMIVPARNEEHQIEACIASLLATRHPDFEVIAVDDCSEDSTRAILERMAARDPKLRVLAGAPLPAGWVGKPWALAQGARVARGDWLVFTDADTQHRPLAASSAQQYALKRKYDVISLLTDQKTVGVAEHLILPTILFVILLGTGAVDDVNDPRKPDVAIFNGQYIAASRAAYWAIGGHAAVKGEIAEDLELARLFKSDGRYRTFLAGANGLVSTRMYRSFGEIWRGFVKNFALGARGRPIGAALGVTLLTCVSPVSPLVLLWLLANRAWGAASVLALTIAIPIAIVEWGMRRMRFPTGSGLALPLGLAVTLAIFATSLFSSLGGGVEWRGRRYGGGFGQRR
jgi:chlorobactene glucosyltransferase